MFGSLLSQDSITYIFTAEEALEIDNYIQELEQKDSLNIKIIKNLENQIYMYIQQSVNDSTIIDLKRLEIQSLKYQVELHQDLIKEISPKWYNNKWMWFAFGIISTYSSVYLAGQISN